MNKLTVLLIFLASISYGQQLKVKPHQLNIEPIYIDTLNKRVGIGTTSPNKQLTFAQANDDAIQIRRLTTGQGNPSIGTGISWTWTSATYNTDNETWAAIRVIMPGSGNTNMTFSTTPVSGGGSGLTERMRITDTGNVGIGTTSPTAKLHITSPANNAQALFEDGNRGVLIQSYNNLAGVIGYNGSVYNNLELRAQSATQLFLSTAGNVGIGTTSPSYKLDVYQGDVATTGHSSGDLRLSGNLSGYANNTYPTLKTSGGSIHFDALGTYTGYISYNTGFVDVSDGTFKTFVEPIQNATDILMNLKGVRYSWIDGRDDFATHAGFVAQQVLEHYPEAVTLSETGIYGISSPPLIALAVTTIQEQQKEIEELKTTIQSLITRIQNLENQ